MKDLISNVEDRIQKFFDNEAYGDEFIDTLDDCEKLYNSLKDFDMNTLEVEAMGHRATLMRHIIANDNLTDSEIQYYLEAVWQLRGM